FGDRVSKTFSSSVHRGPEAVIVVVLKLVTGGITGDGQAGTGDQSVAIVPRANALLENLGLLRQGHGAQLDVRDPGACARPDPATIIREQLLDMIIRQVASAGEILSAVALRSGEIQAQESLRRAE